MCHFGMFWVIEGHLEQPWGTQAGYLKIKSSQVKSRAQKFGQVKPQVKYWAHRFGQVKPQVKSQAQKFGQVKPQVK